MKNAGTDHQVPHDKKATYPEMIKIVKYVIVLIHPGESFLLVNSFKVFESIFGLNQVFIF